MKKLLAIAVTAALAAPMAAQAAGHDKGLQIGGQMRFETRGSSTIASKPGSFGSYVTFVGATPLNRTGAMGTYGMKMRLDADSDSGLGLGGVTSGNIGIKAGSHWVRVGSNKTPMDNTDDVIGFLPTDGGFGDGASANSIDYTGSFGPLKLQANIRPDTTARKVQASVIYKAGPFSVGVATSDSDTAAPTATTNGDAKTRFAAAYSAGAWALGLGLDKNTEGGKASVLGGKYTFGNTTVSLSTGKTRDIGVGTLTSSKFDAEQISHKLGAKTRVYLYTSKTAGGSRSTKVGLEQKF